MNTLNFNDIQTAQNIFSAFHDRLMEVYSEMDREWKESAERNGFVCNGCADNCCLTRFHHHTYLEYFMIRDAVQRLSIQDQDQVCEQAGDVCRLTIPLLQTGQTVRLMCPVNVDGLCRIYPQRPMICRLHGIAYEFRMPDGQMYHGAGCLEFDVQKKGVQQPILNRTRHYTAVAQLENEFRKQTGLTGKIKMTVAEMIAD